MDKLFSTIFIATLVVSLPFALFAGGLIGAGIGLGKMFVSTFIGCSLVFAAGYIVGHVLPNSNGR